jgi:stage V sporulation protein SpoVS
MPNFVKVSGESDPRKVAGKLAHTCRDNPAPAMLTIGTKCINQAVKAICIARGELRSCLSLYLLLRCCQSDATYGRRQQAADQAGQWTCCHLALDTCSCRLQARHAPKKRSPACMMRRITLCNFMVRPCCEVVCAMRGCIQQQALQYAIPCRKVARQLALRQLALKAAALSHP